MTADLTENGPYAPLFDDVTSTGICLFVIGLALWASYIDEWSEHDLILPEEKQRWERLAKDVTLILRGMHKWRLSLQIRHDAEDALKPASKRKRRRSSGIPKGASQSIPEPQAEDEESTSAGLRRSRRIRR
jgi:hypothetical protein